MTTRYNTGKEIICSDPGSNALTLGKTYIISMDYDSDVSNDLYVINDAGRESGYYAWRFKATPEPVPVKAAPASPTLLTVTYEGITITVDPSIRASRKFADSLLDFIYN